MEIADICDVQYLKNEEAKIFISCVCAHEIGDPARCQMCLCKVMTRFARSIMRGWERAPSRIRGSQLSKQWRVGNLDVAWQSYDWHRVIDQAQFGKCTPWEPLRRWSADLSTISLSESGSLTRVSSLEPGLTCPSRVFPTRIDKTSDSRLRSQLPSSAQRRTIVRSGSIRDNSWLRPPGTLVFGKLN